MKIGPILAAGVIFAGSTGAALALKGGAVGADHNVDLATRTSQPGASRYAPGSQMQIYRLRHGGTRHGASSFAPGHMKRRHNAER